MPPISSAPSLHRAIEQLRGARARDDAALRERDDLDRDESLSRLRAAMTPSKLRRPISVSTSTWLRMCSVPRLTAWRTSRSACTSARQPQLPPQAPLVLDALEHRGPGLVRAPRQSPEGLVEMHVRVDQAGQQDAVGAVDHGRRPARGSMPGATRVMTPSP